jgi:tetratricopeptide (TPR) repeat protein
LLGVWLNAGLGAAPQRQPGNPTPTFTRDIAPILAAHCVECHRQGGPAPFVLTDFESARRRATLIAAATQSRFMPPWKPEPGYGDFLGSRRLDRSELETLRSWASSGAPHGSGPDRTLTASAENVVGPPDLVVRMPDTFELPADGPDVFRLFVVAIPVDAPRFVRAIQFSPGTPAVHHATMLVDQTGESRRRDEEDPAPGYAGAFAPTADYPDGHFLGWAPGQQLPPAERQLPWRLNPGTDLVIQLHLKPTGKPEDVRVSVSFFFGAAPPSGSLSILRLAREDIDIPAGAADISVEDSFVLPADSVLYAVQPHAHYRATRLKAWATLPDGSRQWLISIPEWDFDWQDMYYFRDLQQLPRGTILSMQFVFDNSSGNPRNPERPPRRVRWGQSSTDEMAEVLFQLRTRDPADSSLLQGALARKHHRDTITGYETRLAVTPGDVHLHDDIARLYREEGRLEEALAHFRESARLMPASVSRRVELGRALVESGQIDEAAAAFEQALTLSPDNVAARTDLGVVRALQNRLSEAVSEYDKALDQDPAYQDAHNNLSAALLSLGRVDESFEHARRALELQPEFPAAHYNMARALLARAQPEEARWHMEQALRGRPDWPAAIEDYAWMLATDPDPGVRNPGHAIELAERAVVLTRGKDSRSLDVLGAAYASAQRFDEARRTVRLALDVAALAGDGRGVAIFTQHLDLYVARHQVIDPSRRHLP